MGNTLSPCINRRPKVVESEDSSDDSNSDRDSVSKSLDKDEFAKSQRVLRREPVYGGGGEEEKPYEEKRDTTKSREAIQFIDDCCKSEMLFNGLDEDQRMAIIEQMYTLEVKEGTEVIVQGDKGNEFYVIWEGSFKITVNKTEVATFVKGQCFGELALIYDSPRAATVVAAEDSKLFVVHRLAFRTALKNTVKEQGSRNMRFLKSVKEFNSFSDEQIRLIDTAVVQISFLQGEVILKQNDEGDRFYLIISGACEWTKTQPTGGYQSGDLSMGDCFGERALIKAEKRSATIIAKTTVKTLTLTKDDFHDLLGSGEIFEDRLSSYDKPQGADDGKTEDRSGAERTSNSNKYSGPRKSDISSLKVLNANTVGVLGQGAFGIVTLVSDPKSEQSYAMKAIKKCQIAEMGQQKHVINEMLIMRKLAEGRCSFLVNLIATYKDKLRVYFLLDVCLGGELFTILRRRRNFSEKTAKFYTACVVEGFDYMHGLHIVYRDLKPENLVLTNNGYLKITDFGFAKKVTGKTFTLCGTPDYLAPEIVTGQGHGRAVDWWTLGILLYEMVASFPPFYDEKPINTYRKIIKGKIKWVRSFSPEVKELIQAFLQVRPVKRLGMQHGGAERIRSCIFFKDFAWKALQQQTLVAPIRNKVKSIEDMSNFEKVRITNDDATPVSKEDDFDKLF